MASLFLAKQGDPKTIARRLGWMIALLGLGWTLAVAGIGVAIWGSILLLSTWLSTAAAVLITGALAVAIAALILFRRRQPANAHNPAEAIVERFPMESVVLAAAAGFVIAHFPEVRTLIVRQIVAR